MSSMCSRGWIGIVVALSAASLCGAGPVVVSNVYENLDAGRALADVPVTFSRIGAAGDFTEGIAPVIDGVNLPAQVNVLRHAPDGSIRHALVSFVLPKLDAGGKVKIDWLNAKPAAPPAFRWGFDRAALGAKLVLTRENGQVLTSDAGKLLGGNWAASPRVKLLHDGPVMKEVEIHDIATDAAGKADDRIEVYWRLRAFTGVKSVRVAAIVERCKDRRRSHKEPFQDKFQSVELTAAGKSLYREGPYDHLDQTRYRILAWTDGPTEDIHRAPNYEYWVKGRFFPNYHFTGQWDRAKVDSVYPKPTADRNNQVRQQGILEHGIIHRHMPGTGGRWEMEPYPAWSVGYVLSGAPKTYQAILHADGNGAGAFFIHVRQDGAAGYDIRTVKQPAQDSGFRPDLYRLPDGGRTPVQPDHAHAPSLGYVAYLLTGDKFYAEEASFWAAYQMGEWPHKGLRWQGLDRAFAYGLRHVVDAAFILPDGDPLKDYFAWGVNDCMDQMNKRMVQSGRRVHAPPAGNFTSSGRPHWVNAKHCSVWQYSWVVWSLGNAVDKGFAKAAPVRDWTAEYIVGFYTSDDEFKAPDGKTYRYDPRDAVAYSTAIEVVKTEVVTGPDGKKTVKMVEGAGRPLENYGEIWYYTKLNVDNSFHDNTGLVTAPDAKGNWPLREKGWGAGMTWNAYAGKQERWWAWHRYGSWVALVTAVEADVPKAKEAWKIMTSLTGKDGEYGYEMIPR
ncbi:MAG TPA: hypothetical protein VFJ30_13310 [Phycisphaerae bacterium]|nr:hypothetical protein [Phycisphaerae bacterium]